jgi:hypothetical protein
LPYYPRPIIEHVHTCPNLIIILSQLIEEQVHSAIESLYLGHNGRNQFCVDAIVQIDVDLTKIEDGLSDGDLVLRKFSHEAIESSELLFAA